MLRLATETGEAECDSQTCQFHYLSTLPKGGAAWLHWLRADGLFRCAVLAERRAAAHISDARLLVAAGGRAGLAGLVRAGGRDQGSGLQGAAGHKAPSVVLRGVGQAQAVAGGPGCGAPLTRGHFSLADTPPHLHLLQLGNLLMETWRKHWIYTKKKIKLPICYFNMDMCYLQSN